MATRFQPLSLNSKQITIALHILIWGAVLTVPYLLTSPGSHQRSIGQIPCNFFTVTNVMHIGVFYFNAFFLYSRFLTRRRWWIYVLCMVALIVVIYNAKLLLLNTFYPELAKKSNVFAFTFFPIVFFLILSTIYRLVLDKMRNEREQLSMELKFLRSQISPHFLFNVLNNLVSMARYKSDLLEPSLMRLSGLMRYMLYDSAEERVPLNSELEYLKGYIELQQLRFGEDVAIEKNIQSEMTSHTIEPMLLIPFVENAFKHGMISEGRGAISIQSYISDDTLHFSVENKLQISMNSKDKNSGIGITNVRARLNLLYPQQHHLKIEQNEKVFSVQLSLNLK